ncbi:hypothetical protein [Burkholderia gladioli]|uniref:hypothetical protein n=1 Tax=Burkholderia gladioli TaxID=28095 RepID=UPI00163DEF81|nr:hypothetical protein [Burkholderia gladioli]
MMVSGAAWAWPALVFHAGNGGRAEAARFAATTAAKPVGKKGKARARVRMMSGSLGVILFLPAIGRDARHYQNDSSFQRGTLRDVEFLNAGSGFAI